MAIISIRNRDGFVVEVPTAVDAAVANEAVQSQLSEEKLAFLCVENHAFAKSEIVHLVVLPEDDEPQELVSSKEEDECSYMG